MAQLSKPRSVYEVCITRSDAEGGTTAKALTKGGLNTVMPEAEAQLNSEIDFKEHFWAYTRRELDISLVQAAD